MENFTKTPSTLLKFYANWFSQGKDSLERDFPNFNLHGDGLKSQLSTIEGFGKGNIKRFFERSMGTLPIGMLELWRDKEGKEGSPLQLQLNSYFPLICYNLPVHHVIARMSIREQTPTPFWSEAEIARLLDIPSPLSPWLSPLPQILSPPLFVSSPPLPASPTYLLGYRAAMIRLRVETPSTSHPLPSSTPPLGTQPLLPIPLPTSSLPLLLPFTFCRACVYEVTLPPRKWLCIALSLRYEVGKSSSAPTARPTGGFRVDYGFVGTLDDECNIP
ncbi:hypothetical protein Tco_1037685 [Tanacetum coccineum]